MHRYYKVIIVVALALLTLSLMVLDRTHVNLDDAQTVSQDSTPAQIVPDVTFTLIDGGAVSLRSLSGHTVLLHFWASWCAPCRQEFSGLLEHMAKEDGHTILLAVSVAMPGWKMRAVSWLRSVRRDYKSLFDSGKVVIAQDPTHALIEGVFQTFKYPETIIIAPDLTMRRKMIGMYKATNGNLMDGTP